MNYSARVERARQHMAERGIEFLLIGQPANRQYLTGFSWNDESSQASSGWVVLTATDGHFLTNFLHFEAAQNGILHLQVAKSPGRILDALVDLLAKFPAGQVGFEGGWLSYSFYEELAGKLVDKQSFVPIDGLVEQMRVVKDADEIAVLRRAIAMTDEAYNAVTSDLRPGQTERQIAWALERALRELGADGMSFGPAVAAGPHAAVPHHEPTDYVVRPGDPIWIDMGAKLDGYCADLTRSFCLDMASNEYLNTWDLVLAAQRAALTGLRDEITGKQADALSRDLFSTAGRGDEFGHSLGHGVGLMIHEGPRLAAISEEPLQPGMVVTVEPGLYVPGWGGVRIEDVALVEANGITILSNAPKQPVIQSVSR